MPATGCLHARMPCVWQVSVSWADAKSNRCKPMWLLAFFLWGISCRDSCSNLSACDRVWAAVSSPIHPSTRQSSMETSSLGKLLVSMAVDHRC